MSEVDGSPIRGRSSVELTTLPLADMIGGELVVGCEPQENGDVWLYLNARHRNEYAVFPAGEAAARAKRAWHATGRTHLWMVTRDA
jgi:hypothetical protein